MANKISIELSVMGGLECFCNGKRIEFVYNTSTKLAQLALLLLYNAQHATPKSNIINSLYRDADADAVNSLKTLFSRLRTVFSHELGIPGKECVILKDGVYSIPDNIEVHCDAQDFMQRCAEVVDAADYVEPEQLEKTCGMYRGELLPMLSTESWVIFENTRLTDMYYKVVRTLCKRYLDNCEAESAYRGFEQARKYFPYEEEWIIGSISALLDMGKHSRALEEYEEVTQTLFDELGIYPSERLLNTLRQISASLSAPITTQNSENTKERQSGAFYCSFPSFHVAYNILYRIMDRENTAASLLRLTVTEPDGTELKDKMKVVTAISCLHIAVGRALRASDMFTRYSATQLLVLLWNATDENTETVIARIEKNVRKDVRSERFALQCETLPKNIQLVFPPIKEDSTNARQWQPIKG